jgi:hypothetical protein
MNMIAKLKSVFGYTWAAVCLVVVLATFVGLNFWAQTLAKDTGIRISPHFSGGEVRQTIDHGSYITLLHRLVFDGLVSERSKGFIQIDWVPQEKQQLPAVIEEELDIDGYGSGEVLIHVDMSEVKAKMLRQAPYVIGLEPLIAAGPERILRVQLRNPYK